jgi:isocitrate dehydrogenase (NAD+)
MASSSMKLGSAVLKGLGQKTGLTANLVPAAQLHLSSPVHIPRITCTLIPGDGVGPELMDSAQEVLSSMGAPVDFEEMYLSEINHGSSMSLEDVTASVRKNGVCLKGVITVPEASYTGELMGLNQSFRNNLDLYANVVKVRSLTGVKSRHQNVDCVIIREQTEGEYSAIEHESVKGVVECLKVVTAYKSHRIAKFAFDYATRHGRKKVTAVHKANIMKLGDGLFLRCCGDVAKLYPNIEFEQMIVDNTTMQLVSNPQQFDVMVMPNLYGNIIDNLAVGLVGGAGVVGGASYSADLAVFEPGAKHTFDNAAGKNIANPTAALLAAAKMLQHVGLQSHGEKLKKGVERVLKSGKVKTRDLGGYATTKQFTAAVVNAVK